MLLFFIDNLYYYNCKENSENFQSFNFKTIWIEVYDTTANYSVNEISKLISEILFYY